jgi:hypothetical protein
MQHVKDKVCGGGGGLNSGCDAPKCSCSTRQSSLQNVCRNMSVLRAETHGLNER